MRPLTFGLGIVLISTACSLTTYSTFPTTSALEQFDEAAFEAVRHSREWKIFKETPYVSLDQRVLPLAVISRCALVASFTEALDRPLHDKIKKSTLMISDDFTGTAMANLMDHPQLTADLADRLLREGVVKRYAYYPPYEIYAGLFCGIQNAPSRLVKGLSRRMDRNNSATVVEFFRDHNRAWMTNQWKRLAEFNGNYDVRTISGKLKDEIIPDYDIPTAAKLDERVDRYMEFRRRIWTADWLKPFLPEPDDPRLRRQGF